MKKREIQNFFIGLSMSLLDYFKKKKCHSWKYLTPKHIQRQQVPIHTHLYAYIYIYISFSSGRRFQHFFSNILVPFLWLINKKDWLKIGVIIVVRNPHLCISKLHQQTNKSIKLINTHVIHTFLLSHPYRSPSHSNHLNLICK